MEAGQISYHDDPDQSKHPNQGHHCGKHGIRDHRPKEPNVLTARCVGGDEMVFAVVGESVSPGKEGDEEANGEHQEEDAGY